MIAIKNLKNGQRVPFDITKVNPVYQKMLKVWAKCRDAYGGGEDIKARGDTYLPKPSGLTDNEYKSYLTRAQWYGATERTVQAYLGMLFQKDPIFEYRDMKDNIKDDDATYNDGKQFFSLVTYDGKSIEDFLRTVVEEVLVVNKIGILVDFPSLTDENGQVQTLDQFEYEQKGLKPLLSLYKAETIVNWYYETIDNRIVPRFFVLKEKDYVFETSESIVPKAVDMYRILYLDEVAPKKYEYSQYVIQAQKDDQDTSKVNYVVKDIITPIQNGKPIPFIPFYVMTDKGLDYRDNSNPMINALVNTNIGHFRNSADWENELHWVGTKTIYFPGWDKTVHGNPRIGGALAGPANSVPQMLEASSDSGLKDEMKNKEERMAVLGAERISQKGRYIPSAETARINSESENSTLTNMSKSLSTSISKVLTFQLAWMGKKYKVRMNLNTDFFNDNIKGDEVLQWVQAAQQGGISFDTYYYNMKRKEAFPEGWTKEKEIDALQEGFPGMYALSDLATEEIKAKALAEGANIVTSNPIEGKTVPLKDTGKTT